MQDITRWVWENKYRRPGEQSRSDSFSRVVRAIYAHDDLEAAHALRAMNDLRWCPAGRIHAGAGAGNLMTTLNCYVSPTIQDSMLTLPAVNGYEQGIMDSLRTAAITLKAGGGIGMDFSTLRPKGTPVNGVSSVSTGPVAFMDMWDSMCQTIKSAGHRRGAMMGTLADFHPDIREFIVAKSQKGRLTNFNVSVLVSDKFMQAVKYNGPWQLKFPLARGGSNVSVESPFAGDGRQWYAYETISARELWDLILRQTYENAEPGVIFIDRVNKNNPLYYVEDIRCTNPCGEEPLPPNGACCLGHINLAACVRDPFLPAARVDDELVRDTVRIGVRFLDNVLVEATHPTDIQAEEAVKKRRIGLGVSGVGNMLQQLCVRYGTEKSAAIVGNIMEVVANEAYLTSSLLAAERGSFPLFDREQHLNGEFIKQLGPAVWESVLKHGLRNGVLLAIAPTGTTSIYYDNISGGLEPTYQWRYKRQVRMPDGDLKEFETFDWGWAKFCERNGHRPDDPVHAPEKLPDYMVTALDLSVDEHLTVQEACQDWIDASVSKTINCPEDMSFDAFKGVYDRAYELGLKTCSTYRPSEVRGSVLSVLTQAEPAKPSSVSRPAELDGHTYKVKWPSSEFAYYITINNNEHGQPHEIFINSMDVQHQEWMQALTRMVSAIFRRSSETDVRFVAEELSHVHSPSGGHFIDQKYVPSLVALLGQVIARHFERCGMKINGAEPSPHRRCPHCNAPALVRTEGCDKCANCGYSSCE